MKKNALVTPCVVLAAMCALLICGMVIILAENSRLGKDYDGKTAENNVLSEENSKLSQRLSDAQREADAAKTEAEELKKKVSETEENPDVQAVPAMSGNIVYIYDNGDTKIDYPIVEGAKQNDYDLELLKISDNKHKELYNKDGRKISRFGIDVSSYQGKIDWNKVKADGVEFAIIRAGYRGYETGAMVEDKYFRQNITGAVSAGVDAGVYFFSQAITEAEAVEEADFILRIIADCGAEITMPIVFDWEFPTDEDPARTDDLTGEMQTLCCKAFCERIKEAGYEPMYYSTVNTALFRYDMGELADYGLWVAEYCERTQFTYDYRIWQYSCSGVIDGINALTDLNILIEE